METDWHTQLDSATLPSHPAGHLLPRFRGRRDGATPLHLIRVIPYGEVPVTADGPGRQSQPDPHSSDCAMDLEGIQHIPTAIASVVQRVLINIS